MYLPLLPAGSRPGSDPSPGPDRPARRTGPERLRIEPVPPTAPAPDALRRALPVPQAPSAATRPRARRLRALLRFRAPTWGERAVPPACGSPRVDKRPAPR